MAVAIILIVDSRHYFKPYNLSPQESLAGYQAHGISMANLATIWPNPFVAKNIDVDTGSISLYHHWPNGFFLLSSLFIKIFGNSYLVGRSISIALFILGLLILIETLVRKNKIFLLYLVFPLIFLSAIGKDAIPFFFADAALNFFIGLMLYLAVRRFDYPRGNAVFWTSIFVAAFFNQLIILFVFGYAIISFFYHKKVNLFLTDVVVIALSSILILLVLAWDGHGFAPGLKDLWGDFLYRTSIKTMEPLSFPQSIKATWGSLYYNIGWIFLLVPLLWLVVAIKRDWWIAGLIPTFMFYSLIFRNYTGHQFTKLMFVVFAFLTFITGFFYLSQILRKRLNDRWRLFSSAVLAGGVIALFLAVITHRQNMQYAIYGPIDNVRIRIEKLNPAEYEQCTRFAIEAAPGFSSIDSGMAAYYFGMNIVRGINYSLPDQKCTIVVNANGASVIKN